MLCLSLSIYARPALPGTIRLRQPDGTTVLAIQKGDEYYRILTDLDGHALIKDKNGYFCYARYKEDGTKVSTGWAAGKKAPDSVISQSLQIPHELLLMKAEQEKAALVQSQMKGSSVTPMAPGGSKYKKKCVVILANFADTTMRYTQEHFEALFNQPGYSFEDANGSVMDYFTDQFPEPYEFTFEVSPIVTLPHTQSYYGDGHYYQAVADACKLADEYIDFSQFDGNADFEVDNVFLIVAGTDQAESGNTDAVWAHQYYLKYYDEYRNFSLDGKKINTYVICSELAVNYSRGGGRYGIATIGTLCHEYGHALGLADMYDCDGTNSEGKAEALNYYTGIMDCGCYNDNGHTPAHYNAIDYDTVKYGDCEELAEGEYNLAPISVSHKYYKVSSGVKGEYYLIECRDHSGWDKEIKGKGLAIYHIDKSTNPAGVDRSGKVVTGAYRWSMNAVNNNPNHQCADMIEPDVNSPSATRAFFPWDGKDSFTPATSPSFKFWDGSVSPLSITDIKIESDGSVSFNVKKTSDIISTEVINVRKVIFQHSAQITFENSFSDFPGKGVIRWGEKGGTPVESTIEPDEDGKFICTLQDLTPGTDYSMTAKISYGSNLESKEVDCSFTTYPIDAHGQPYIYLGTRATDLTAGQDIPLVVFNSDSTSNIRWYLDGTPIYPDKNGYFKISKSGILKAVLRYSDGDTETITKHLTVK